MFGFFRQLPGVIQQLVDGLRSISDILPEVLESVKIYEPLEQRIAELERGRSHWEATVEAQLLRSDSKYKASRAAEERSRTMLSSAEALSGSDEGEDAIKDEYLEFLRSHGEGVGADAVQPVLPAVAVDPKTRALQAKFGAMI